MEIKLLDERLSKPDYATQGSAAIDLRACSPDYVLIPPGATALVGTGIALNMTSRPLTAGLLLIRSSWGKKGLTLANSVGLIDNDYQEEIKLILVNHSKDWLKINPLDRIAQLMFIHFQKPYLEIKEQFDHRPSQTRFGGIGSTGDL